MGFAVYFVGPFLVSGPTACAVADCADVAAAADDDDADAPSVHDPCPPSAPLFSSVHEP